MPRAQCSCGKISAMVTGEPTGVVVCHCFACQRRTGSPFGVGAYYLETQVEPTVGTKVFTRTTEAGGMCRNYFCPDCGTTVYWRADKHPGKIGIAVGAFADPHFAVPVRSVWEQAKHDWVEIVVAAKHFQQGSVAEPDGAATR